MPLHILIIMPTQGQVGGLEINLIPLVKALKQVPNYAVEVYLKKVTANPLSPQLINLYQEQGIAFRTFEFMNAEVMACIHKADTIHTHNFLIDVLVVAALLQKQIVSTVHHYYRPNGGLRWLLWRWCSYLPECVVFISKFVAGSWAEAGFAKPYLQLYSTPLLASKPLKIDPERRKGFIFISRLIHNKGLELLLKAYHAAALKPEQWPLYIVGEGPLKAWGEAFVRTHNLQGVHFLGYQPSAEKEQRLAHAKWLVATPAEPEDLGLTPVEARLFYIPVIITPEGGLPEAAGVAGLKCSAVDITSLKERLQYVSKMEPSEYESYVQKCTQALDLFFQSPIIYSLLYVLCNEL